MPVDWSSQRIATMQTWLDYRSANRKRVKPASWTKLIQMLAVLDDAALDACVSDSIANGWQGLFPYKFTLPRPTGHSGDAAILAQKKEGAAPPIKPADFPWRDVAISNEGWTPEGEWEDQTARTRKQLRETWASLSAQGKQAIWALAQGSNEPENREKKEGGAADE